MKPACITTPASQGEECRCTCGSLVARIAEEGVELRCRRCKRTLLVPWSARDAWTPVAGARTRVSGGVGAPAERAALG